MKTKETIEISKLARKEQSKGNYEKALKLYKKAYEINPDMAEGYLYEISDCKVMTGDFVGALTALCKIIKIDTKVMRKFKIGDWETLYRMKKREQQARDLEKLALQYYQSLSESASRLKVSCEKKTIIIDICEKIKTKEFLKDNIF